MLDLPSSVIAMVEQVAEIKELKLKIARLEDKLLRLEDLLFEYDTDCGNEYVRKAFEIIRYG